MQPIPSSLTWKDIYTFDNETVIFMQHLMYHHPFNKITLSSLPVQYRCTVANNSLGIVENCFIFYELVPTTVKNLFRIIVPVSLRHTIFSLSHSYLAAGHMGEHKTLYRIKLRFFWPKMRSEIH